eukprot:Opistho-2@5688
MQMQALQAQRGMCGQQRQGQQEQAGAQWQALTLAGAQGVQHQLGRGQGQAPAQQLRQGRGRAAFIEQLQRPPEAGAGQGSRHEAGAAWQAAAAALLFIQRIGDVGAQAQQREAQQDRQCRHQAGMGEQLLEQIHVSVTSPA